MNAPKKETGLARPIIAAILIPGILFAVGCSTTAYKRSDATAVDLQRTAMEVQSENQRLDDVSKTLNDLVNNPAADLKQQFKMYSAALDRLHDSVGRTDDAAKKMQAESAQYFAAWDKQLATMHYDIIREQSQSRRDAVSNQFEVVNSRYIETREVVLPLLAYLEDIRKALSADLTADGLAAVKNIVDHANDNARKVQEGLARLADGLHEASARMSSVVRSEVKPQTESRTEMGTVHAAAGGP